MNKKRIEYLDYAKALAIFSVLFKHSSIYFSGMNCFTMAVFFIASGYTYNSDRDSFSECFTKRLKRLMVPFWTVMAVDIILEIIRAPFLGYGTATEAIPIVANLIYGSGYFPNCGKLGQLLIASTPFVYNSKYMVNIIMPTNCHLWALPAMFTGYILFYLYLKIVKNRSILTDIVSIVVLLVLASVETIPGIFQLPFGIGRGFVCAAFMIAGFFFRENKTFEETNWIRISAITIISLAVTIAAVMLGSDAASMVTSYYGPYGVLSVMLTFVCGLCSSYVVIMLCRFIHFLSIKPLNNMLAVVGRNTMEVYLWQFTLFFIFDAVFILLFNPVQSHTVFVDEVFSEGYIFYRIFRVFFMTLITFIRIFI